MAYAILRIGKIKSHSSATSKAQHNYRLQLTPNADPDQQHCNQEYLNHVLRNYWDLAQERIQELGLKRLRSDAVRAVEVLLTASPEAFRRDAQGRAADMRDAPWTRDNLRFLQQHLGERNVVSFTLHQDEVTPHVHAVVIPITEDGRLSARDVFSPKSLRQLQTDYAQAMAAYGVRRGVHYSTAIH
ncbi:plasmid recombination protein [Hymenobacter sp. BT188]|uniref:MobV family relaxase n=1 Tax=Hymenobacter sp. BT188 TaxID=2763504 RepID=UPI0016514F56|nr:MobV family relaxase [Hymenobacter sp. BT188]MBC6608755.1 plasmid recombination protein [Hymenobacter sp. BT188]